MPLALILPTATAPRPKMTTVERPDFPSLSTPTLHLAGSAVAAEPALRAALALGAAALTKVLAGLQTPFAVGMTDSASGRTLLAVDRFGVQSLCYAIRSGHISFAPQADAIAGPATPLDLQALFDYLYFHAIPSPRTIFEGVFRLPPGHFAVFDQGRLSIAPYWVATFDDRQNRGFEVSRDEFRRLLRTGVASQLDGGKPACFLSGGTDSSTIAGVIGEVAGRAAATYSIGFEAQGYDEMAFARIAAKHFGTEHHEYYVTPGDLVSSIPAVAASFDQPFGNSSAVPAYHCARMAREDGVTRLLAGDGGDELFGGNSRYATERVFGWYGRVPQPVRSMVLEPLFTQGPLASIPGMRKVGSYIRQASTPLPDRLQSYNLLLRLGVADVLTPEFLTQVDVAAPQRQQREIWVGPTQANALNRNLAFDWRYTLAESDLPKVCGSAALAGMAVGFPLLDTAMVDFSTRLPSDYKLRGLKLRWFFKEALRGFLPDEILTKKKQGFGLPFGVWTTQHSGLLALAKDSLAGLATRGVVRPEFLDKLIRERLHEHPGYYGGMIWILMMLEQWLRHHRPNFKLQG